MILLSAPRLIRLEVNVTKLSEDYDPADFIHTELEELKLSIIPEFLCTVGSFPSLQKVYIDLSNSTPVLEMLGGRLTVHSPNLGEMCLRADPFIKTQDPAVLLEFSKIRHLVFDESWQSVDSFLGLFSQMIHYLLPSLTTLDFSECSLFEETLLVSLVRARVEARTKNSEISPITAIYCDLTTVEVIDDLKKFGVIICFGV